MNKKPASFRLSEPAKKLLAALSEHHGISQASVIEMALRKEARLEGVVIPSYSDRVCSIGYQKRSIHLLLDELIAAGVTHLVDVRENPWSRQKGYAKGALSKALVEVGIEYVHLKHAGNPQEHRRLAASHAECLEMYAEYLAKRPEIVEQMDAELSPLLAAGSRVCLFCYERHPDDCHRSILLDAWGRIRGETRPLTVDHLAPEGAERLL